MHIACMRLKEWVSGDTSILYANIAQAEEEGKEDEVAPILVQLCKGPLSSNFIHAPVISDASSVFEGVAVTNLIVFIICKHRCAGANDYVLNSNLEYTDDQPLMQVIPSTFLG
jgi:hypothetical protein